MRSNGSRWSDDRATFFRNGEPMRRVTYSLLLAFLAACSAPDETPGEPPEAAPRTPPAAWIVDVTEEVGIDFVHETGEAGGLHLPSIMSAGAALFDYDGDGDLDAYFTNGSFVLDPDDSRPTPRNRLYRQEDDGSFVDATDESGLGDPGYGMGLAVGDVDNDGDLDVYLGNFGADRLYLNRGDGTFEDATEAAGLDVDGFASSVIFCDYDVDGDLDVYVARYVSYDRNRICNDSAGRRDYCTPAVYPAEPDILLRNNGDGTFTDASVEAGIRREAAAGLGVVCDDFDDNGLPDFYVANDKYANHLWLNQGGGTFRDQGMLRGAAYNMEGRTEAGMGIVAEDLDGDADLDLYVTHIETESNTLYRNLGGGLFEDATATFGLVEPTVPFTGFGVAAFDVELDGDLDLVVVNGRVLRRVRSDGVQEEFWAGYSEGNLFLMNEGGRYRARPDLAESFAGPASPSRALATGDVDGDGDLDLLVASAQARGRLFRNDAPHEGNWLIVRTVDPELRRDAIGARVTLLVGGSRIVRRIAAGWSYVASSDPRAHFGLGEASDVEGIEVRWLDGLVERFGAPELNRAITLRRGEGEEKR